MDIKVVQDIMRANDLVASGIKDKLARANAYMVNIMGSPGSGKTLLVERMIEGLSNKYNIGVIEGDIRTSMDSERLAKYDIPVMQINTESFGGDCHLPAPSVGKALEGLELESLDMILVENVGNLVCPAEFCIGENIKVVVLSLTEGEDKPLKYSLMFRESDAVILSKLDLLPHLDIDMKKVKSNALSVNSSLMIFPLSAKTGEGIKEWLEWLGGAATKRG